MSTKTKGKKKKEKKNYHLFRQSASKTSTQATSYSRFQAIRYMRCYLISVTVFQALYLSCFIGTYYGTKNVMQRFPLTPFYKQFSFFICLLYMYIYICMSRNLSSTFMKQFWQPSCFNFGINSNFFKCFKILYLKSYCIEYNIYIYII